jgi:hypothetical protein
MDFPLVGSFLHLDELLLVSRDATVQEREDTVRLMLSDLADFDDAVRYKVTQAFVALQMDGRVKKIETGTRLRVLSSRSGGTTLVRVESGLQVGTQCWTRTSTVH